MPLGTAALTIAGWIVFALFSPKSFSQQPSPSGPLEFAQRIVLPTPGSTPAGFRVEVLHERLTQFGDLPMRVIVTPTTTSFSEDRQLTIRVVFNSKSSTPNGSASNYQFSIPIKAGEISSDQTVYLPKWFLRGDMRITVLESGQPISGYTDTQTATWYDNSNDPLNADWLESLWIDSAAARVGWIAKPGSKPLASVSQVSELDDVRIMLLSLKPEFGIAVDLSNNANLPSALRSYGEMAGFRYRTIQELPNQWQGFQQSHVWATHWNTWETIEKSEPEIALAMRQFVRCGGALWLLGSPSANDVAKQFGTRVRNSTDDREDAQTSQAALQVGPSNTSVDAKAESLGLQTAEITNKNNPLFFTLPDPSQFSDQQYYYNNLPPLRFRQGFLMALQRGAAINHAFWQQNSTLLEAANRKTIMTLDFGSFDYGAGVVVCCTRPDSLPGEYGQWIHLQDQTGIHLSSAVSRGIDPIIGDVRFWNWTIPGVAQPPVYSFIGILFLFVVLVGPIAYRQLNRAGRAYLMFFVAPLLAGFTTVVLFLYGIIADGLGTQARIRQITLLCDNQGNAVQYWRSTYFAGVRPSDGLAFPPSTRVEPYRVNDYSNWYMTNTGDENSIGTITVNGDGLRLSSGFFPARQQRQFVAYRPLENAGGLFFAFDELGSTANITSRFTYDLREVVVCDDSGKHWYCENLSAGATMKAAPLEEADLAAKLSDLYMRQMPMPPPGFIRSNRRGGVPFDLVTSLGASILTKGTSMMSSQTSGESHIDWWLRETLQTSSELSPGLFVAVADVSSDCIASPGAKLVESIHYVVGNAQ